MANDIYAQQFRQMLKMRRRKMTPAARARPIKQRPWLYPWAVEARYAKQIKAWMKPLLKYTEEYIATQAAALLRGDSADAHMDNRPGVTFSLLINALNAWAGIYYPSKEGIRAREQTTVEIGIGQFARETFKTNGQQWGQSTEAVLGVSFDTAETWWQPMADQWSDQNYKLIKSLTGQYIDKVNQLTESAIVNGWTAAQLLADIKAAGANLTDTKARLIARDQIGKLNGAITQARMEEVGLTMYTWSTSQDERVRASHRPLDGLLCQWADASVYSKDKGKTWEPRPAGATQVHPGYDIQCRCTALAYYDELVNEIDQELELEAA